MEMNTLDELERLINEATPGTWSITEDGDIVCQQTVTEDGETYTESLSIATGECSQNWGYIHWGKLEDAALIVAAINALPGLIERAQRAERLEAELEAARVHAWLNDELQEKAPSDDRN
jgi:inosine/xanthosine triphosphate pyrophosphatase family protein